MLKNFAYVILICIFATMKKYKYPEPSNSRIFVLSHFDESGNACFECGHKVTDLVFNDLVDIETGYAEWNKPKLIAMNYKLSKPKAFEASEPITTASGIVVANLLRSGIKNQTVILVGHAGKWHEIEIESLRIDEENFLENSHLESVVFYIESNNISLSDMVIVEEVTTASYDLEHSDFMELSGQFPDYDYIAISKLHEYEKRNGLPNGKYHKKQTLQYLTGQKLSIADYITQCEERKHKIISESRGTSFPEYSEVVDESKPQQEIKVETVPVPEDSVSLQLFEKLTPEKITELQGLRIQQEKIVAENPVIVITNKTTYAQAKKNAAILLSASTTIDGTKGIEATATKYLNTFKTMLKTALQPIAKITRDPYDKQKKLIEDWDNRLILQAQNRVKELFLVPFVFNGSEYSVGTLVITQKDIEELSDADFSGKVAQGKAILIALESVKTEQDSIIAAQAKQIAEMKAMLEQLLPNTRTHIDSVKEGNYSGSVSFSPVGIEEKIETFSETPFEPAGKVEHAADFFAQETKTEEKQYQLPNPNNKLLNELDLAHVSVLEEKQYLECRSYYAQALQDAADSINDILVNPDKTVQKSVAITELIKTWKL